MLDIELRRWELNNMDRHEVREAPGDWVLLAETKKEAKHYGETYYYTGHTCKHGHLAPCGVKYGCIDCRDRISFNRAQYFDPIQRVTSLNNGYKRRADKKGLDYNLTVDYLLSIFPPDYRCPILGLKCYFHVGKGRAQHNSWSLDRIDNELGYIQGNVMWVSQRANGIKRNLTPDQMIKIGIIGHQAKKARQRRSERCRRTEDLF